MDGMAGGQLGRTMIPFTIEDVRRCYDPQSFARGFKYYVERRAKIEEVDTDTGAVRGSVQGSEDYYVAVSVSNRSGKVRIGNGCSCPVGGDCKHGVALACTYATSRFRRHGTKAAAPADEALPVGVTAWLTRIGRAAELDRDEGDQTSPFRLFYILDKVTFAHGEARPVLSAVSVRSGADGLPAGEPTLQDLAKPYGAANAPKYLRLADIENLQWMARLPRSTRERHARLDCEGSAGLLARLLPTGRCRWQSATGPVLRLGETRPGRLAWGADQTGHFHLRAESCGGDEALSMPEPYYVDAAEGVCGRLDLGLAPSMTAALMLAPALPASHLDRVHAELGRAAPALVLPPKPPPALRIKDAPRPRLRLAYARNFEPDYWMMSQRPTSSKSLPLALLDFDYGGTIVAGPATERLTRIVQGGRLVEVERRVESENKALMTLHAAGMRSVVSADSLSAQSAELMRGLYFPGLPAEVETNWLEFLANAVPMLIEAGWNVRLDEDFPYRVLAAPETFDAALSGGSGIDWFDISIGALVDGERVDILPALIAVMRQAGIAEMHAMLASDANDARKLLLPLGDGRSLTMTFARVRPILAALTALFMGSDVDGPARVKLSDAAVLAELEAATGRDLVWRGGETLRAMGARLRDKRFASPVLPAEFTGMLRPYQQSGVGWMQLLRDVGLGGVLADDMGLGKTVQTLAHLAIEKASGRADRPSLIVAPTSVLPNWVREIAAFTPMLSVLPLHGLARRAQFGAIGGTDIVLTTYPLLPRDIEVLAAQPWHMVVIDEAQMVKNPATAAAQALRRLTARQRIALSGTPLENHLGELWALFDFVLPGFLGGSRDFARTWRTPIEKGGDKSRQEALARRCRPFMLRRTKALVAADLPPKTEIMEHIDLGAAQRSIYESIRLAMQKKVREAIAAKGLQRSRIEFLDALLKLRQACCDPRLVKRAGNSKAGSAKLERLMEMLHALLAEGRRVLLFSQFTSMLALIEDELRKASIRYVMLTGQTKDRVTPVRQFQEGAVQLFLISLKAGGTGLNLTAADTVIHYDPWWNPAVEAQATDRAHRIGQTKPVFVHKLIAEGTVEVKMGELAARKRGLAAGLFAEDGSNLLELAEADVEFLLGEG